MCTPSNELSGGSAAKPSSGLPLTFLPVLGVMGKMETQEAPALRSLTAWPDWSLESSRPAHDAKKQEGDSGCLPGDPRGWMQLLGRDGLGQVAPGG